MAWVDPSARVEDGAVIGEGTTIGPFCFIGAQVEIGANCKLVAHVHVMGQTVIGDGCTIYPFASLGAPPQISNLHDTGRLRIGAGCTIRESVTISSGSPRGGGLTTIGDRGYFMNCTHVGHDCHVGNDVIFATSATLGGHCEIGDFVFIGGLAGLHQFSRVGAQAMIAAHSTVVTDIIPFAMAQGSPVKLRGLNVVGMKRRNVSKQRIAQIRAFYRQLFHGPGLFTQRLAEARLSAAADPAMSDILTFIDNGKNRELCMAGRDT